VIATLALAFAAAGEPVSTPGIVDNRWAEPARAILVQRCGQCHLPNLPTSVPRALAVFDLTDEPWYGRLTNDQFGKLLSRVRSLQNLPEGDGAIVESFVRCARDRDCRPTAP
jgi:hypothetical protein